MGFVAATIGTVVILVFIFVLLNRKYPASRNSAGLPSRRTELVAAERIERENPGLVQEDVRQMLAAQNALREKRGAPPMTPADLRAAVAEDNLNRAKGRGPFAIE